MTQDKSRSKILQDRALADFIQTEYPIFVEFIDAYFTWLEQSKKSFDITRNLRDYRDVDETLDEFVQTIAKETMVTIPKALSTDRRLLSKHIKSFYLNKGNEASYRFLFQILYNEEIEFYYPKVDILRASAGKWYERKSLKIEYSASTLSNIQNTLITGSVSGARALVETSYRIIERGEDIIELTLSNIKGEFESGESIIFSYVDSDNETQTETAAILEVLTNVTIDNTGSSYSTGDKFDILDGSSTVIAQGTVDATSKGGITGLTVDASGIGYSGLIKRVTKFYALPSNSTLNGDYLPTTPVDGSGSGASGTDYTAYTFDEVITSTDVAGSGDPIAITDSALSFGSGASGIVTVVGNDGEILEVGVVSEGEGYQTPTATVISSNGSGAEISVIGGGGAIASISLDSFPVVLESDYDSNGLVLTADFTDEGDGNASAILSTGVLAEHKGVYLNDDGKLSSTKKLQDNFYYQDFSYVIKTGQSSVKWIDIIKRTVHPAGLQLFGEVNVTTTLQIGVTDAAYKNDLDSMQLSLSGSREDINISDILVDVA